ncbi:MAG: dephospho-CoA kinase [Deltaproteobacteria bacterium]|nr:dephospho-CoA kinase [Deltaproteobacteria bacterium]
MASVLGLSGGIGTGKSTVARFFDSFGATVIDADAIVHELQAPGAPMLDEITEAFGPELVDAEGRLDRQALGAIAFGDVAARKRLEEIVHPKVTATIAERVASAQAAGAPLIVIDIPLLFERSTRNPNGEFTHSFDAAVLVYASEQQQIERQMSRDGCDRDSALQRVRAQLPIERKKAMADVVIDNTGSLST